MLTAHRIVAGLVLLVTFGAAVLAGLAYYRRRELGEGCMKARRLYGVMTVTHRFSSGPGQSVDRCVS